MTQKRVVLALAMAALAVVLPNVNLFPSGALEGMPLPPNGLACLKNTQSERPEEPRCRLEHLPYGTTFYSLYGPSTGPKVVCVHGMTVPSLIMRDMASHLASKGYNVLTYDLYGRGYSASPDAPHDEALYVVQLTGLLFGLGESWSNSTILGLSLGGGIAAQFARQYPERVSRLVLLAPAGMPMVMPILSKFARMRRTILGDMLSKIFGSLAVQNWAETNYVNSTGAVAQEYLNVVANQLDKHPGFVRSVISTVRDFPMQHMYSVYEEIGRHSRPVLVVWGTLDNTVPYYPLANQLMALLPHGELASFINKGHSAIVEHPAEVQNAVSSFLLRSESMLN